LERNKALPMLTHGISVSLQVRSLTSSNIDLDIQENGAEHEPTPMHKQYVTERRTKNSYVLLGQRLEGKGNFYLPTI
jgi:hypothetical protein